MKNKNTLRPTKTIHIVDDIDAKSIERGYYEDIENNDKHLFISVDDKSLPELYSIDSPQINETYIYDQYSGVYVPMNEYTDEHFSISKLEAYINVFEFMGATELKGEINKIETKKRNIEIKGGVSLNKIDINGEFKKEQEERFSSKLSRIRIFGGKNTRNYEEIQNFIIKKGLSNDIQIKSRLEELKNNPNHELKGTYAFELTLTKELNKSIDNIFQLSCTPFFKADTSFGKKFSTETEISYKVEVKF